MKKLVLMRKALSPVIGELLDVIAPVAFMLCLAGVIVVANSSPVQVPVLVAAVVIGIAAFMYTLAYILSDDAVPFW